MLHRAVDDGRVGEGEFCGISGIFGSVGVLSMILCETELTRARQEFAISKEILFASKETRRLLHTLIPPNVLENMSMSHKKAKLIPRCTVMLYKVPLAVIDMAGFNFMNELFLEFDGCVQVSGL